MRRRWTPERRRSFRITAGFSVYYAIFLLFIYGPMIAMMFRRLKFDGPNWEAMKNMGPFAKFLLLTGSAKSDSSACP